MKQLNKTRDVGFYDVIYQPTQEGLSRIYDASWNSTKHPLAQGHVLSGATLWELPHSPSMHRGISFRHMCPIPVWAGAGGVGGPAWGSLISDPNIVGVLLLLRINT